MVELVMAVLGLAQVTHWTMRSSIYFESPGHQTDVRALDRHLLIPR